MLHDWQVVFGFTNKTWLVKNMFWLLILVGGLEHFLFFHILGIIIPTDYYFFSEGLKPPTSHEMSQKNTAGKHHCTLGPWPSWPSNGRRLGWICCETQRGYFRWRLELTTQRGLKWKMTSQQWESSHKKWTCPKKQNNTCQKTRSILDGYIL